MHDFCTVSLSDRLTPWTVIEQRLKGAAAGDFVVALYNPRSKGRDWQLAGQGLVAGASIRRDPSGPCPSVGRSEEAVQLALESAATGGWTYHRKLIGNSSTCARDA